MYDMSPQHIREVWMSVMSARPALRMREIRFMRSNSLFKRKYIRFQEESSNAYCAVPAGDLVEMCFYSRFFGIDDSFDHDGVGWSVQIGDCVHRTGSGADTIMFLMKHAFVDWDYTIRARGGSEVAVIHPLANQAVARFEPLEQREANNNDGVQVINKDIVSWLMED